MAPVTDAKLAALRTSNRMYERAASVIAAWARDKERGTVLPSNSVFQKTLAELTGDEPSPSVWKRAKNYLVTQGVLSTNDGPFQVALQDSRPVVSPVIEHRGKQARCPGRPATSAQPKCW
jgi:hypothetical protein